MGERVEIIIKYKNNIKETKNNNLCNRCVGKYIISLMIT